ncbi:MAG: Asparagine synthetase AsnB1, partial [Bacteroidota bacterium]
VIEQQLSKSNLDKTNIFDFNAVQQLIQDNQTGKIDASYTILSLLSIQSWLNQFFLNTTSNNAVS